MQTQENMEEGGIQSEEWLDSGNSKVLTEGGVISSKLWTSRELRMGSRDLLSGEDLLIIASN